MPFEVGCSQILERRVDDTSGTVDEREWERKVKHFWPENLDWINVVLRPSAKNETVKINEFNASGYVQMHLRF